MNHHQVTDLLLRIGDAVCEHVYRSLQTQKIEQLSAVVKDAEEDTIYAIDREVECIILPMLEKEAASLGGIYLIAEGMGDAGSVVLPEGIRAADAKLRIIMDPIDGTRGIMYNKRSAFFLAAAAPNRGVEMFLQDLQVAVMTEIPTSKAYLSDAFFAQRGQGAKARQKNLLTGEVQPLSFRPSASPTIIGGFAQIARFFPPGKALLAEIEEELVLSLADVVPGKALVFEDQYISSGGQLYELLSGHDRFVADLRTALYRQLEKSGTVTGLCCHPYDVCATLIGEEAGIHITDIRGEALNVPLNLIHSVDWIGYANSEIRQEVEPVLQNIFKKLNWIG
jgi:fructose-1,6-bisphosphatase/inositol monophosphatase family enzyme